MSNLREIKNSIESIKKTSKLTSAMKMVAAAKFKRATHATLRTIPYMDHLKRLMESVKHRLEDDIKPALMIENASEKEAIVIIAGDRGLCGGFNTNLFKRALHYLNERSNPVELHLFGNKTIQFFKKHHWAIESEHGLFSKSLSKPSVRDAMAPLYSRYENGEIGKITIIYNEFKSALSCSPTSEQLAPIAVDTSQNSELAPASDYFYQTGKEDILNALVSDYISTYVYKAFIGSQAAEEGARMAAMDSATNNAKDMIHSLTLLYNRKRQAQITSEITEIVAGANALGA